jgi:hypothetical protein
MMKWQAAWEGRRLLLLLLAGACPAQHVQAQPDPTHKTCPGFNSLWHCNMQQQAAPHVDVDLIGYDTMKEDACIHRYRPHVLPND